MEEAKLRLRMEEEEMQLQEEIAINEARSGNKGGVCH